MKTTLPRVRVLVGAAVVALASIGCGSGVDAEPAPTCITHPQLCPASDGGSPPPLVLFSPPTGFDPFDPGEPSPPPGDDGCPGDRVPCEDMCVDPENDPEHCGGCGIACRADQQCRFGQCCGLDEALCDGVCIDPQTDERNCGSCGFTCELGSECVVGLCTPA